MEIEHMSGEDALLRIARVERTAQSEMPTFVAAPRPIGTRVIDDEVRVIFECDDSANDATYIIEVPGGRERPRTEAEAIERLNTCAVAALEQAERTARAVFN